MELYLSRAQQPPYVWFGIASAGLVSSDAAFLIPGFSSYCCYSCVTESCFPRIFLNMIMLDMYETGQQTDSFSNLLFWFHLCLLCSEWNLGSSDSAAKSSLTFSFFRSLICLKGILKLPELLDFKHCYISQYLKSPAFSTLPSSYRDDFQSPWSLSDVLRVQCHGFWLRSLLGSLYTLKGWFPILFLLS